MGNVFHFDWMDPTKVSVVWYISGNGNYDPTIGDGDENHITPLGVAADVYLNE